MSIEVPRIAISSIDLSGAQSYIPPPRYIPVGSNIPTEVQSYYFGNQSKYGRITARKAGQLFLDSNVTGALFCAVDSGTFPVSAIGNAKISTAQSKFGGSSAYFDGDTDALAVPDGNALRMQEEDFTIEFWVYPTSLTNRRYLFMKGESSGANAGTLAVYSDLGDGKVRIYSDGVTLITATTALSLNTWQHLALVRKSQYLTLYLNGLSVGSTINTTDYDNSSALILGAHGVQSSNGSISIDRSMVGYIDDFRITKGVARYEANFSVPSTAFSILDNFFSNVTLLLSMNGVNNSIVFDNSSTAQMLSWKRCLSSGFNVDTRTGKVYDPYYLFYNT